MSDSNTPNIRMIYKNIKNNKIRVKNNTSNHFFSFSEIFKYSIVLGKDFFVNFNYLKIKIKNLIHKNIVILLFG